MAFCETDFQRLAAALREDVAVLGGELSIKLFTFATKVETESELITSLAHDVAFLSALYRNLAEVMTRTSAKGSTILSRRGLSKIQRSVISVRLSFGVLKRFVEVAEKQTRARSQLGNGKIKYEQFHSNMPESQLLSMKAEFAEARTFLMLIYHLGDLAFDVKASGNISWMSPCFSLSKGRLGKVGLDLIEGSRRQAMFDAVLALQRPEGNALEPPSSPKESSTAPALVQPSSPAASADEDFEMIDTPSTGSGSPVCVERIPLADTFSCTLPDRSLPISVKTGHKRPLDIDATEDFGDDAKSRRKSEDNATHSKVKVDSAEDGFATKGDDTMEKAIGADYDLQTMLLQRQRMKRVLLAQEEKENMQSAETSVSQENGASLNVKTNAPKMMPPVVGANHAHQDYVLQLEPLVKNFNRNINTPPTMPPVPKATGVPQDFQTQLMLLELETKQVFLDGLQEQKRMLPAEASQALQELQMILLEQENRKRIVTARQEGKLVEHEYLERIPTFASQGEYQMHLMQLEKEKKERLLMARRKQERTLPVANHVPQDYQMQLMLLEQQNKKRLLIARQEQDRIQSAKTPAELSMSNMDVIGLPVTEPDVPPLDNDQQTSSIPKEARHVLLKYGIRSSALSKVQIKSFAAQNPIIQENLARAWAQEPSLLIGPAKQMLLCKGFNPEQLSPAQMSAFASQPPDVQGETTQNHALHLAGLEKSPKESAEQMLLKNGINPGELSPTQMSSFTAQPPGVQELSIRLYAKNLARHQRRYGAPKMRHLQPESPRSQPPLQSSQLFTDSFGKTAKQGQNRTLTERSTEILREHGLKPDALTADQVKLMQSATQEQLERFVKAWAESSPKGKSGPVALSEIYREQESTSHFSQPTKAFCTPDDTPGRQEPRDTPAIRETGAIFPSANGFDEPRLPATGYYPWEKQHHPYPSIKKNYIGDEPVIVKSQKGPQYAPSPSMYFAPAAVQTLEGAKKTEALREAQRKEQEAAQQNQLKEHDKEVSARVTRLLKRDKAKETEQKWQAEEEDTVDECEELWQRALTRCREREQKAAIEQKTTPQKMLQDYNQLPEEAELLEQRKRAVVYPSKRGEEYCYRAPGGRLVTRAERDAKYGKEMLRDYYQLPEEAELLEQRKQAGKLGEEYCARASGGRFVTRAERDAKYGKVTMESEQTPSKPLDEGQKAALKVVEGLLREYTTLYD